MSRHLNLSTALIRTAVAFQDRMDELQEAVLYIWRARAAGLLRASSTWATPPFTFRICS